MAETDGRDAPKKIQFGRRRTDRKGFAYNKPPQPREESPKVDKVDQDDGLIGTERFPRKGDDE